MAQSTGAGPIAATVQPPARARHRSSVGVLATGKPITLT